jgi:uncharacterized membrane protein
VGKGRLEAFSDGVLAIIITIMVLEMKVPHGASVEVLKPLLPVFLSYILSFVYIGIYWNNHHHMLHATQKVNGIILWANLHLLFWLSLIPFTTGWMGENNFAGITVALYGFVLFMCAAAYYLLEQWLVQAQGEGSHLAEALGRDTKALLSLLLYGIAIGTAFFIPIVSLGCYILVAGMWFLPDRRIERRI